MARDPFQSGYVAELESEQALLEAIEALRSQGYRLLDAHLPYGSDEVIEALALPKSKVSRFCLAGGLLGMVLAYLLLWWTQAVDYPLNVGGRPDNAIPAFIPITFETAVLFGSLAAFGAFFFLNGLPRLYHPLFEIEGFGRASVDRFFLAVSAKDLMFHRDRTPGHLEELGPIRVVPFGGVESSTGESSSEEGEEAS